MTLNRRELLRTGGAALAGTTAIAGCLGGTGGGGGSGSGSGSGSGGGSSDDTLSLAIVSSSAGFGDKAFNDLAVQGLQRAADEYGATLQRVEETDQSNYQSVQSRLAESTDPDYDLIVLVGFQHTKGLETNAAQYPDQRWMLINDVVDQPNVAGYIWANHEMSFQAGVLAGTMTTRSLEHEDSTLDPDGKVVGFTGGVDGPLIRAFERSYVKGVHHVDEEIEVRIGYAGSFSSPQDGKEVAASQYDSGADIVYQAAAASGKGVFQAAQEQGRFAIGVDADQSKTLPEFKDVILGSAVKFINEGTYEAATAVNDGEFSSIQGRNVLGLAEEGVELVLGQTLGPKLPDAVSANLESSRQAIVDGEITVPCSASGCQN
jgi:basic membrane protein A